MKTTTNIMTPHNLHSMVGIVKGKIKHLGFEIYLSHRFTVSQFHTHCNLFKTACRSFVSAFKGLLCVPLQLMAVVAFIFFSPLQITLLPLNIFIALKQITTALLKFTAFVCRSFLFLSHLFLFVLWIIVPSLAFQSVSLHLFYNFFKMFMVTPGDISDRFKNLVVSLFSYHTYELLLKRTFIIRGEFICLLRQEPSYTGVYGFTPVSLFRRSYCFTQTRGIVRVFFDYLKLSYIQRVNFQIPFCLHSGRKFYSIIKNKNLTLYRQVYHKMKKIINSMARIPAGLIIFLIAMVPITVLHRIVVVAKLPSSVDQLLTRAYSIIEAMTDNVWFPTPSTTLLSVKAAADALKDAQVSVKNRVPGSVPFRNKKKNALKDLLYSTRDYIQSICILNPDSATGIAESALMYAKKVHIRQKQVFSVSNYLSGSIKLLAANIGTNNTHDWQISRDISDPAGWTVVIIPSTKKSRTIVSGLKPGELVYFRHRVLNKDGYSDWDEFLSIIVK